MAMSDEDLEQVYAKAKHAKRDELVAGRSDEEISFFEWRKIVHLSNLAGLRAVRETYAPTDNEREES
jgi:hypothetical protein